MQRCLERLANSRQSLLERFRWNVNSSSDLVGSARTQIHDLVVNEWKAFKQENNQQLRTDADPALVMCFILRNILLISVIPLVSDYYF